MAKKRAEAKWAQKILLAALLWYLFLWVVAAGFVGFIASRYQIKIKGNAVPTHVVPGRFKIRDPNIEWGKNLTISSGTIHVHVKSVSFRDQSILVLLWGKNLEAKMDKVYPVRDARLVLEFLKTDDPIIHSLNVDSDVLQINMAAKE